LILYDESYNFLGMSEKVLTRLGYEDLDEFCTYHKDFAELFEKENGLIYNFENFSWIDFILYGGANKDRAIITTKNKEKIDVKIEIDEIKIKDELFNMSKLFSVKFIENGIIEEPTTQSTQDKKISLSSMLTKDDDEPVTPTSTKNEEEETITLKTKEETKDSLLNLNKDSSEDDSLDINLSFIKNEELKDDDKSTVSSFSLDFLKTKTDDEETQENKETPEPTLEIKPQNEPEVEVKPKDDSEDEDVVLNFFNSTIKSEQKEQAEQPIQVKKSEPEVNIQKIDIASPKVEEEKSNDLKIDLNFLKTQTEDEQTDEQTPKTQEPLIKEPEIKEEKSKPTINLDFFKKVEEEKEEIEEKESIIQPQTEEKTDKSDESKDEPLINLNFLKQNEDNSQEKTIIDETPDASEQKEESLKSDEPLINLNFLKTEDKPQVESQEEQKEQNPLDAKPLDADEEKPQINLNFLKLDDTESKQTTFEDKTEKVEDKPSEQETKESITPIINLNFLEEASKEKEEKEEISPKEKSQIIKQIKEDIDEIDQPQVTPPSKENEDIVINDALKSILKIEETDKKEQEIPNTQNTPKEEKKEVIKITIDRSKSKKEQKQKSVQTATNMTDILSHLDISAAQKKEILQDFIDDARYNLNLINEYIQLNDIDSVKYLAVKIKSLATTLQLKELYETLENITEKSSSLEEIKAEVKTLSQKIESFTTFL